MLINKQSVIAATLLIITAAFLSVAFPLATYTLTLASFGLAHVLTEFRYVNSRFNQRLDIDLQRKIFVLILVIVNLRIAQLLSVINASISVLQSVLSQKN